ncbi:MAG: hypothetical protein P857_612 [Candidatus Xenolissoclinum pacificiensis L6]|uniref:Uncharacterized protein n=1 Tax=Candidatus Xenolissoclinum pacificiensis L6 TaxID=1401685 RepID=W2UYC5_9RICK|nr:MAG: hypothetical protein P857_612 [Candidatus Xenolissoclinum pacificiensis L6]
MLAHYIENFFAKIQKVKEKFIDKIQNINNVISHNPELCYKTVAIILVTNKWCMGMWVRYYLTNVYGKTSDLSSAESHIQETDIMQQMVSMYIYHVYYIMTNKGVISWTIIPDLLELKCQRENDLSNANHPYSRSAITSLSTDQINLISQKDIQYACIRRTCDDPKIACFSITYGMDSLKIPISECMYVSQPQTCLDTLSTSPVHQSITEPSM